MTHRNAPLESLIAERLRATQAKLARQFATSAPIRYFVLDELLPRDVATSIHQAFPAPENMRLRDTFRERKYVSAQMDRHDPLVEAALFAFHAEPVVQAVRDITGKRDLQPDPQLYAGGVSSMGRGHFLNPHIDNSHDAERARWRNLNLLYYVTPNWGADAGGDLELWPGGLKAEPIVIAARFNRLVVMETHQLALHSVRRRCAPAIPNARRRCCRTRWGRCCKRSASTID